MTAIAQTATATAPPAPRLERTRFCSRCAAITEELEGLQHSYGAGRVCEQCGMGVMLSAAQRLLPGPGAAFLVVTRNGTISAVSEPAERIVGEEAGLLGVSITSAVTTAGDDAQLVRWVARAAGGGRDIGQTTVIPVATNAGAVAKLKARVGSCGPPRAALLVLEHTAL